MKTKIEILLTFVSAALNVLRSAFLVFMGLIVLGCGNGYTPEEEKTLKTLSCKTQEKTFSYDEIVYLGQKGGNQLQFSDLREGLYSACMNCHLAPANAGGFSFIDSYNGQIKTIAGETKFFSGYFEIAEKVYEYLNHPDESLRMPPKDRRDKNPLLFQKLSDHVLSWIKAGKPEKVSFNNINSPQSSIPLNPPLMRNSELGECTPSSEIYGSDYIKDLFFEKLTRLPQDLSETDIFTFDSYELAKKGTLSYNVEYPLWADNSNKGRWFHLPVKRGLFGYQRAQITFDQTTQQFDIPENTRFYKNFYKKIKQVNGKIRFKRIETRIIVVRKPWQNSLYGTYKWDDSEQSATLVDTPYRDGTGFKDIVFQVKVDEATLKTRPYAIPGLQRCLDCHRGSSGNNGVLGFTPLQLNRREFGDYEKPQYISEAERSQVQRFIDYKIFNSVPEKNKWPKLETMSSAVPSNIFEYRAQGYLVGNCSHCHTPQGLAFLPENGINLDLRPGSIFQFNTKTRSVQVPSRLIVHQNGDLDQSHIWRKVSDSTAQLGMTNQMPMNTPGAPDCNVLRVIGKWIRSFESLEAAQTWEPECKKENEFKWIDQDFTIADDPKNYIPKRPDWKDSINGMPQKYKNLEISDELEKAFNKEYAVGYWSKKPECKFPEKNLTSDEIRPWMMRGDKPKRPFGEIYFTTPGSYYYRTSCMKCHGSEANGDSSLARAILMWSGGSVRVANFMDGMFGQRNANIDKFLNGTKNYAPQYLVWMAMEGTRVQFPPELSSFLGKHGGQMLNQMREKCINQVSPAKPSSAQFVDHEVFEKVCFVNNLEKNHADLKFDESGKPINPVAFEEWADRAAYNIGFSIFDYLKKKSAGALQPGNDQCEILYKQ